MTGRRASMQCVVIFFTLLGCDLCRAGDNELQRFKEEYPVALNKLNAMYGEVRGTGVLTVAEGTEPKVVYDIRFAASQGCRKVSFRPNPPDAELDNEDDYIINANQSFNVAKPSFDAAYTLDSLTEKPDELSEFPEKFGPTFLAAVSMPGSTMSRMLPALLNSAESATEITVGRQSLLEVRFNLKPAKSGFSVNHLTILFDPNSGWVIRRFEAKPEANAKSVIDLHNEYQIDSSRLKSVKLEEKFASKITTFEVKELSFVETDPKEFTLDFYRLTSPPRDRPTPAWIPYVVAGVVATITIAALILRRSRNKSR